MEQQEVVTITVDYTTAKKKSKMIYKKLTDFVKENRTTEPKDLIKQINKKLIGIFNYYGISGNFIWMKCLYNYVLLIIKKWLSRRSQRGKISWDKMNRIIEFNPLVRPSITFSLW